MKSRLGTLLITVMAAAAFPHTLNAQDAVEEAQEALRTGEYQDALRAFNRLAARTPKSVAAHKGRVRTLITLGRYEQAEAAARTAVKGVGVEMENSLGEALYQRGKSAEAEAAFTRALEGGAHDRHTAAYNLARLHFEGGQIDLAMEEFDRFIDVYNESQGLSSADLRAVGLAVRYLARRDPQLFRDALRALDEAVSVDSTDLEARVATGELFLEKYNSIDAKTSFREVLQVNPSHPAALVGMARAMEFDGTSGTVEQARAALKVNSNYIPAKVFLAQTFLAVERFDEAEEEAREALEVNSASLEALSALAAAQYLRGDLSDFEETRDRALALNPRYPGLHNTVADLSVQIRRYSDAVSLASEAVRLDDRSWVGYGLLGINQLRVGQIEEGAANLARAFEGDPFNVWFKNTLDLLDTFERYEVLSTEHFDIALDSRESDLLAPYFEEMAEEAFESLSQRYGYSPPTPIRIEVFPSHTDFSVRTVGLGGLGALGVSFGSVVAMDSPSARGRGEFNWASTLWHEIGHSFHMGLSDHRVPRWFSEGLAVHDQRSGRPAWGHQPTIGFLQAWNDGRLHPVSRLNDGFMRPAYPQQVIFSYYQASLVFQMIEDAWGFQVIPALLRGYAAGGETDEVFKQVLDVSMGRLDRMFERFFEERFARELKAVASAPTEPGASNDVAELRRRLLTSPDDFVAMVTLGRLLREEGSVDEAITHLERAQEIFPEYSGPDNPYGHLALIRADRGEVEEAASNLERLTSLNESNFNANLELARLLTLLERPEGALEALARAAQIYPYELELHERLAGLYQDSGQHHKAVLEHRAILGLDPVDRAAVLYGLARAHFLADELKEARRVLLQALEIAPNYEEALELLLELRASRSGM